MLLKNQLSKISGRECNHPTCEGPVCRRPKVVKPKVGIKRFSDARAEVNKIYNPEAKKFREDNPLCVIKIPGICTKKTQGVHHMKGKRSIKMLLDKQWWRAACHACNNDLENHPESAEGQQFKLPDYEVNRNNQI